MRADNNRWTTWQQWFELAGGVPGDLAGLSVNNHVVALELARKGLGAVIAWETLTKDLIDSGDLVRLTPIQVKSPISLIAIRGPKPKPGVDAFVDWILNQIPIS